MISFEMLFCLKCAPVSVTLICGFFIWTQSHLPFKQEESLKQRGRRVPRCVHFCSLVLTGYLSGTYCTTNKIYKYTNVIWHYFTLQILVSVVSLTHNETEEQGDTYNRGVIPQVFCSALVGCGKLQKNIWKDICCHKDLKSLQLCHQARHAVTW